MILMTCRKALISRWCPQRTVQNHKIRIVLLMLAIMMLLLAVRMTLTATDSHSVSGVMDECARPESHCDHRSSMLYQHDHADTQTNTHTHTYTD